MNRALGPLAVLALGALALWWLYRRASDPRLRTMEELRTSPLPLNVGGFPKLPSRPIVVDLIDLRLP